MSPILWNYLGLSRQGQGSGRIVPLEGGAFLSVTVAAPGAGVVGHEAQDS